ncbi:MAG: hypothetical protein KF683_15630, partial [Rubrivivax sp.]|nr:hypothetical protein [Rubrivivax sp.]
PWWAGGPDPVVQAAAPPLPSATEVVVAAPAPASSPAAEVGLREPPAGPERATADPVAATATATATEATQAGAGRGPAPERASRATPLAADDVPGAGAVAAVGGRALAAPARPVDTRRPRADAVAAAATSPAQTCAGRTGFALYQCMQLACAKPASPNHAACAELRRSDAVD